MTTFCCYPNNSKKISQCTAVSSQTIMQIANPQKKKIMIMLWLTKNQKHTRNRFLKITPLMLST